MKLCLCAGLGLLVFAAVAACGGKSATDGSAPQASAGRSTQEGGAANSAGGAANGGSANSAGGAANGGATPTNGGAENGGAGTAGASEVSTVCPSEVPVLGASCHYLGRQCNYSLDVCSSAGFLCVNGVWQMQANNDGASLTCFNYEQVRPKDGDSCACRGMLDCTFDDCADNASSPAQSVHAVCDNTSWHVTSAPCMDAPCGPDGLLCARGEACVVRAGGIKADYQCVADPCAAQSQTLSCACASSLCHGPSERCTLNGALIDCVCDTC